MISEAKPMLSVIIPVYKAENKLCRCVDSIIKQDYQNFEVILVNDGSPDKSGEIADNYAKKDKRIKVIHKENGGVSSARNTGIDASRGEFITFIDSDDEILDNFFSSSMVNMSSADLYISGIKMIFKDNGLVIKEERYSIDQTQEMSITQLYELVGKTFPMICICGPCNKIYKSEIIKKNNIRFDTTLSLGEDTLFNLAYNKHVEKVHFDNHTYYLYYREDENSLFSRYREDIYEIHKKVYDEWRRFIEFANVSKNCMDSFEQLYFDLMIGCIHHTYKLTKDKKQRKAIIEKVIGNKWIQLNTKHKSGIKNKIIRYLIRHKHKKMLNLLFWFKYR